GQTEAVAASPTYPVNPDSDNPTASDLPDHANPEYPENPDSDNPASPHRAYADIHCQVEAESIYQSIVRRASDRPTLGSAKFEAAQLIADFNRFAAGRDPEFALITVPDQLLTKSLTQRLEDPESYIFDPAEYYDSDRDDFYFCMCGGCADCDELEYFIEFMRELEEETDYVCEDP
ncbi:MAG: hypothetical protein OXC95_00415, partial [Dehalococcoidia bacterium]|nr:hypothetical protein [Dehalococcoidia bacterium]